MGYSLKCLLLIIILFVACSKDDNSGITSIDNKGPVDYNLWEIKDGKFYMDGQWKFLKIAKPLRNFADKEEVDQLIML
jgi:hypothetical protein